MKLQYLSPKSISIHICASELLAQSPLNGAEVSGGNVEVGDTHDINVNNTGSYNGDGMNGARGGGIFDKEW